MNANDTEYVNGTRYHRGESGKTFLSAPSSYRMAEYPNGEVKLQGCFTWNQGTSGGFEWRDMDKVKVDWEGKEL